MCCVCKPLVPCVDYTLCSVAIDPKTAHVPCLHLYLGKTKGIYGGKLWSTFNLILFPFFTFLTVLKIVGHSILWLTKTPFRDVFLLLFGILILIVQKETMHGLVAIILMWQMFVYVWNLCLWIFLKYTQLLMILVTQDTDAPLWPNRLREATGPKKSAF